MTVPTLNPANVHDAHRDVRAQSPSSVSSVMQIETNKLVPLIIVLSLMSGGSIAFSVITLVMMNSYKQDLLRAVAKQEQEARMAEYYIMELDGKLMASRVIEPNRSWSAQKRQKESK